MTISSPGSQAQDCPSPIAMTRYFNFCRVDDHPALWETYKLRYQVYCVERGFLPTDDYPGRTEEDGFDRHSVHFLGRHRYNNTAAGTVRMVFDSDMGLPLLKHCTLDAEYAGLADRNGIGAARYAEVSRMAVSKVFRQRANDSEYGGPARGDYPMPKDVPEDQVNPPSAGPEIVAGIYKCVYQHVRRKNLAGFLAAIERSLFVLLTRMNIRFEPIGPEIDYYGLVRPYILPLDKLEDDMLRHRPEVLRYWLQGLEPAYWPATVASLDELQPSRRQT